MTPELSRFDAAAQRRFPAEFGDGRLNKTGGVFNLRRKKLAKPPKPPALPPYSEHAWSNAKDYYIKNWNTAAGKALGDRFAAWARESGLAAEVFWQVPGHYNHVHVTARPRKNFDNNQIPPGVQPHIQETSVMPKQLWEQMIRSLFKPQTFFKGDPEYWVKLSASDPNSAAWKDFFAAFERMLSR